MNNQELQAKVHRLETELRLLRGATEEYKVATTQTIEGLAVAVAALESRLAVMEKRS